MMKRISVKQQLLCRTAMDLDIPPSNPEVRSEVVIIILLSSSRTNIHHHIRNPQLTRTPTSCSCPRTVWVSFWTTWTP